MKTDFIKKTNYKGEDVFSIEYNNQNIKNIYGILVSLSDKYMFTFTCGSNPKMGIELVDNNKANNILNDIENIQFEEDIDYLYKMPSHIRQLLLIYEEAINNKVANNKDIIIDGVFLSFSYYKKNDKYIYEVSTSIDKYLNYPINNFKYEDRVLPYYICECDTSGELFDKLTEYYRSIIDYNVKKR